jgi:hypothetical protein
MTEVNCNTMPGPHAIDGGVGYETCDSLGLSQRLSS